MTTILPHVAFIGRAGAGKTTAAELLVKHFGYERLSFAAPLKVMAGTTTDRGLLQSLGTGVRALCPDAWVNLLVDDLYSRPDLKGPPLCAREPRRFVIDDCRFPNEAQRLCVEGFLTIRIEASRITRIPRLKANGKLQDEAQLEHVSERALDDWSARYTIVNDGTPDDLLNTLTNILNREQR